MGKEKGLVLFKGKPMIAYAIEALKPLTTDIIIIANNPAYGEFDLPVHVDLFPDKGPLGGICTGLEYSNTERNFLLSCDTPFVTTEVLQYLNDKSAHAKLAISLSEGEEQPLAGIYSKSIQHELMAFLNKGQLSLRKVLSEMEVMMVEINDDLPFYHPKLFYNINRPVNLKEAEDFNLPDV